MATEIIEDTIDLTMPNCTAEPIEEKIPSGLQKKLGSISMYMPSDFEMNNIDYYNVLHHLPILE